MKINSVFVQNASGGITLHYIWTEAAKAGAFIIAGSKVVQVTARLLCVLFAAFIILFIGKTLFHSKK